MDEALESGPVHIVEHGQFRYVVLTEQRCRDLLVAEEEANVVHVKAALADVETLRDKLNVPR